MQMGSKVLILEDIIFLEEEGDFFVVKLSL
jgi:hypothetical protein